MDWNRGYKVNLARSFSRLLVLCLLIIVLTPRVALSDGMKESAVTTGTQDFLSDRGRVGSIAGGILAGATLAHPFAPLIGTIVGFFVGKSSDFTQEDDVNVARNSYADRSIVPVESGSAGLLSISDGGSESSSVSVPNAEPGLNGEAESPTNEPTLSLGESDAKVVSNELDADVPNEKSNVNTVATNTETAESEPVAVKPPMINLIISKDVGGQQAELDRLAAIVREERNSVPFQLNQQCPNQEASRIRKKVVVAGFTVEHPDQVVFGGLGSVGLAAQEWLYQKLLRTGEVLPLSAPSRKMFASLRAGPTHEGIGNLLMKYSAVSRQMGAQFVVSGIIRDLDVNRSDSWNSSYASSVKRTLFGVDTVRKFVVDVVVHDGYTGQVVLEKRYSASGRWDIPRAGKVSFGSPIFNETAYGVAVAKTFDNITDDLISTIDCQALLVPILDVNGKDLLLDVGSKSGLLPGDKLRVVRAESSLQRPDAPPKLWDTGVDLHIHQLSLDTSRAWMPKLGSQINIQRGDYAVIY